MDYPRKRKHLSNVYRYLISVIDPGYNHILESPPIAYNIRFMHRDHDPYS